MCVVALTVCCASIKHLFPLEMFLVLSSQSPDKHLTRINRWGEMDELTEGDPLMDTAGSKREITVYMYNTYMQQSQDSDALL